MVAFEETRDDHRLRYEGRTPAELIRLMKAVQDENDRLDRAQLLAEARDTGEHRTGGGAA